MRVCGIIVLVVYTAEPSPHRLHCIEWNDRLLHHALPTDRTSAPTVPHLTSPWIAVVVVVVVVVYNKPTNQSINQPINQSTKSVGPLARVVVVFLFRFLECTTIFLSVLLVVVACVVLLSVGCTGFCSLSPFLGFVVFLSVLVGSFLPWRNPMKNSKTFLPDIVTVSQGNWRNLILLVRTMDGLCNDV